MTADPRITLAYSESVRAIQQQGESLDRLHNRAGLILSAAAITSSLFGAQILRDGSLSGWSWAALVAFAATAAAMGFVLWPRKNWRFANFASKLLGTWVDDENADIDTMRRKVAEFNEGAWEENQARLGKVYLGFQVGSAALGFEVLFWLVDLGTR